jgi:hypothetical protein
MTKDSLARYLAEEAFIIHTDALADSEWMLRNAYLGFELPVKFNNVERCLSILHAFETSIYVNTRVWMSSYLSESMHVEDTSTIDKLIADMVHVVSGQLYDIMCTVIKLA